MQRPSDKVMTAALMALLAGLVSALAADTSVLEPLPDWAEAVAGAVLVALAGYFRRESHPPATTGD